MKHVIDLHGLTHKEAVKKVEGELINISLSSYWEVELITGKSQAMKDIIIKEVLKPYNFFYQQSIANEGVIMVIQDSFPS